MKNRKNFKDETYKKLVDKDDNVDSSPAELLKRRRKKLEERNRQLLDSNLKETYDVKKNKSSASTMSTDGCNPSPYSTSCTLGQNKGFSDTFNARQLLPVKPEKIEKAEYREFTTDTGTSDYILVTEDEQNLNTSQILKKRRDELYQRNKHREENKVIDTVFQSDSSDEENKELPRGGKKD